MRTNARSASHSGVGRSRALGFVFVGFSLLCGCAGIEREYHGVVIQVPILENMPFGITEKGVSVGVDPVVEDERQKDLFDADLRGIGVVPVLVLVVNRGDSRLWIRGSDMRLEFHDGTQLSSMGAYAVLSKLEEERLWSWLGTPPEDVLAVTADTGKANETLNVGAMAAMGAVGAGTVAAVSTVEGASPAWCQRVDAWVRLLYCPIRVQSIARGHHFDSVGH